MSVEKILSPELSSLKLEKTKLDEWAFSKIENAVAILRPILSDIWISTKKLEKFLKDKLSHDWINENSLNDIEFKDNKFLFYGDWINIWFTVNEVNNNSVKSILAGEKIESIKTKVNNIHLAIESIYKENDWFSIFDWEINDQDIINTNDYGDYCEWKNLSQLREMLEKENNKLYTIYDINWESHEKQKLLKKEISFFTGVWKEWLYEWWAKYFALSTEEIDEKVRGILWTMDNFDDIFDYLRNIHRDIKSNFKKSEMVKQVNWKLVKSLHTMIFNKLKLENADNMIFVEFSKILTGRWKPKKWKDIWTSYETIPMYEPFKDHSMANESITYVMMKNWWVLEGINTRIEVQDPDIEKWKKSQEIISWTMDTFNKISSTLWKTTKDLLDTLNLGHVLKFEWEYNNLSFFDKVDLWALVRIENILKNISIENLEKNPNILQEEILNASKESMDELNDSLSDNFDGKNIDLSFWKGFLWFLDMNFGWKDANDLGFQWEFAEVFNLYQDMNGNGGFFDWSDEMQDALTPSLATITTLAAGILVYWAAIAFLAATAPVSGPTILATMAVWAVAWAATWVVANAVWDQWYDTYTEWIQDVSASIALNAWVWSVFLLWSSLFLGRFAFKGPSWELVNHKLHTVPFFSKLNFTEMIGFGVTEALIAGTLLGPVISTGIKQMNQENHFDTDNK